MSDCDPGITEESWRKAGECVRRDQVLAARRVSALLRELSSKDPDMARRLKAALKAQQKAWFDL